MPNKKHLLFILFLFLFLQAKSQNLVPNPSFENTISLPCDYVTYSSDFNNSIYNWIMPSSGTSDIYSTLTPTYCALSAFSTSPYARGVQAPRTGTNMSAFYAYGSYGLTDYREYLEVQLTSPLVVGQTYYVEMYVVASDRMQYGVNNIGMYFSTDRIDEPYSYTTLNYIPQVKGNNVITDTVNWVKISGSFIATTAAQYLTIGNFDDDVNTTIKIKNNNTVDAGAYYYVDDVLVRQICQLKDSTLSICKGNSVTLGSNQNTIVSWALESDANDIIATTPTLTVSPLVTTKYIATYDCQATSIFEVLVLSAPNQDLGNDTTLCAGETIPIDVTTPGATYVWQDGSKKPVYVIKEPGYYTVSIKNLCGKITDNIKVTPCCTESNIPNLFTPNGDLLNDTFNIGCYGNGGYELAVYNRWGALVYDNKSYMNNWGGSNVSEGIYYYAILLNNKSIYNSWVQVLK